MVYSNIDDNAKRFKDERCYLPKGIIKSYNIMINGKILWPSHWFWCKMIWRNKKVNNSTRWRKTAGCLLDYDYIKNHYRLTAVDLSRQKIIRCWSKNNSGNTTCWTIKKKLNKNGDATDAGDKKSMFVLTILEKNKR